MVYMMWLVDDKPVSDALEYFVKKNRRKPVEVLFNLQFPAEKVLALQRAASTFGARCEGKREVLSGHLLIG